MSFDRCKEANHKQIRSSRVAALRARLHALACSRPAARRVLAAVAASCVLVAGLAPAAAGEDASEGFVDADYLCSEGAEHYTDILRLAEPFDDVDDEQAAFEAVRCLFVLGIVWGTTATVFDPFADLSRSQLSALLARAWRGVGLECPQGEAPYVDVAANWAKDDIDCMWQLEVPVSGHVTAGIYDDAPQHAPGGQYVVLAPGGGDSAGGGNKFNPGGSVTNAQFALMAANAWNAAGFSCDHLDSVHFTDVDYNSEAGPAIYCLQQLGVLPLQAAATTFQPDTAINRAEAVTLLARLWREDNPPPATTTTVPQQLQQDPPSQDPAPTKPAKPAKPTLTAGDTKINATWTAPNDGGSAITSYGIRHRVRGTNDWKDTTVGLGTATLSREIDSLTNGTTYEVQVQATNSVDSSEWSDSATATPAEPASPPAAPDAPTLTPADQKLTASWSAPANDGGSPITGYKVRHSVTGTNDWTTSSTRSATPPLSYEITTLTNGTTYEVQVKATNAAGDSGWSPSATGTPKAVPDAPAAPTLSASNTKITANWDEPENGGSAITGYTVQHRALGTSTWTKSTPQTSRRHEIDKLANGTEYEVQVKATNAAGDSGWSPSATAVPHTTPSAPAKPTLTPADQKLTAKWLAPDDGGSAITGYTVQHRATGTSPWTTATTTSTSLPITTLTNGTEYEVQVKATNAAGDSGWSPSDTGTPEAVPDAPAAPTLTAGDTKIDASWIAPNDGGSDITGYTVRHRATGTSSWTTTSESSTSLEITTLANGTTLTNGKEYEVQVQATNDVGDSGWSPSATETPHTTPTKPAKPTLAFADQKLTASWTAPDDGGSDITGYKVQHRATDTSDWTPSSTLGTTSPLSYDIGSLTNGTEYEVRVQATNKAGDSSWSESATDTPRKVPSEPAAPELTPADQKLTAAWNAPSSGGSAITGYTVRHRATGTSPWTTSDALSKTATSHDIGSLTNGTEYEVQVQATNSVGDSGYSDSMKATPRTVPSKPAAPTLAGTDQKLTAAWTAPNNGGSAITGYKVRHRAKDTEDWTTSSTLGTTAPLSYEIGSLTNGTEYEVQVNAKNGVGWGGWSDTATARPKTTPSKTTPTLTPGDQKLTAAWNAPSDGGPAIIFYKVRHRATDTDDWTESAELSESTRTYDIESLTNGTEYEVQVNAKNRVGWGGWSDSAKATPRTVPSKPAAPTLTFADQKLTVKWMAPSDGGSAITGYTIQHRATDTSDWTPSSTLGTTSPLSYEIGSLANGTEYEVQVQATNAAGDSGWSDSAKDIPRKVPSKPSPTLTPADQKLTAAWNAPSDGGSAITGYKVRHRETSDQDPNPNSWTTSDSQTGLTYDISSLTNGTEYEVQVQATNSVGDSGWSDSVKATACAVPSKPAAPTLKPADEKLTAKWKAPSDGGCDITGYKVRHRATSDQDPNPNSWTTSDSQTGLTYDISSLTNGTEYEVQVQATNTAGNSGWSDSATATPRTVPSKPSPTLTPADKKLTAKWKAPSDGGSAITGYKVRHRATSDQDPNPNSWTTSDSQTGLTYDISSLTNGTEYEVQVQATNTAGNSGWSDSTEATPRTVPSKPSPTLTPADKKLTAKWKAPSDGGSAITGYKVRHRATSDQDPNPNSWTTSDSQTGLTYDISSLTNGTEYEVQVQATNTAGNSGWSDSTEATPRTVPSKPSPTLTPADKKLTAKWKAPSDGGSAITGYKVRHRETSDQDPNPNSWTTSDSQTGLTYDISSLTNGTEYEVQVQATNTAGNSGWSDSATATPRTVPSKPAAPTLAAADKKLTATWTAPANGGSSITGYKVRHRETSDTDPNPNSWTTSDSQTGLTYDISSLTNGTEYEVQVQATNTAGNSGWSDSTKATPPLLAASNLTDETATLTLSGTISGNTTGNWWLKRTSPADTTCTSKGTTYTHDLTLLKAGRSYTYTAYSDSNCSNTITAGTFTTLELAASGVTDSTATLTLSGYSGNWYYRNTNVNNPCSTTAVSGSTTNLTGLNSGTTYTYTAFSNSTCTDQLAETDSFTTSDTTVHNIGNGHSGLSCIVGRNTAGLQSCLIGFTTGSNSSGYTVDSITFNMENAITAGGHPSGFKVSLHTPAVNNTVNTTAIANATFSGSNHPASAGLYSYDCAGAGCQLSANTTYYIAMTVTGANQFSYYAWRSTSNLGHGNLPTSNGWSIADSYRAGFSADSITHNNTLMLKVAATIN